MLHGRRTAEWDRGVGNELASAIAGWSTKKPCDPDAPPTPTPGSVASRVRQASHAVTAALPPPHSTRPRSPALGPRVRAGGCAKPVPERKRGRRIVSGRSRQGALKGGPRETRLSSLGSIQRCKGSIPVGLFEEGTDRRLNRQVSRALRVENPAPFLTRFDQLHRDSV